MQIADLLEARSMSLYHATSYFNAVHIIKDDVFAANTVHTIADYGTVKGVSLTRNRQFAVDWSTIAFELDRTVLAARYRLIPFNYWQKSAERTRQDARIEAEEFVIGPITNALRFIVAIHVTDKRLLANIAKLNGPHAEFYEPLRKHPLLRIG